MKLWIVRTSDALEDDGPDVKKWRTAMLAEYADKLGHEVHWITSSFNHYSKCQRSDSDYTKKYGEHGIIHVLHTQGYKRNISLSRIRDHRQFAQKFVQWSEKQPKPDLIFCSLPTLEVSRDVTDYGKANGVPTVLDLRDKWPDVFISVAPKPFRWLASSLLSPYKKMLQYSCANATSLVAVTSSYLSWGLKNAGRDKSNYDKVFYLGSKPQKKLTSDSAMDPFWKDLGLSSYKHVICFFGTLGRMFELDVILEAAEYFENKRDDLCFVICGDGDNATRYKERGKNLSSVFFPGWIDHKKIQSLMQVACMGIAPYKRISNFEGHIPNKCIEYLSAGLPVLTSLEGEFSELIVDNGCGLLFDPRDVQTVISAIEGYLQSDNKENFNENALTLFSEKFNADDTYTKLVKHLELISDATKNEDKEL